jgi:hypothetical protein
MELKIPMTIIPNERLHQLADMIADQFRRSMHDLADLYEGQAAITEIIQGTRKIVVDGRSGRLRAVPSEQVLIIPDMPDHSGEGDLDCGH